MTTTGRRRAENMRGSAQACMDMIGEVLAEAQMPAPAEEAEPMAHAAPEPTAASVRMTEAIDSLTRATQGPSLLDAIDALTQRKPEPSEAQTNFDRVLADIAARALTGAARSAASATR